MNITFARGSHYQNSFVYNFFTFLKLRQEYQLRYQIAAQHIRPGESVLDICAGFGEFKDFLPSLCTYQVIEASLAFNRQLARRDIPYDWQNLHAGMNTRIPSVDVITMIISLCQFQKTTCHRLLEDFKKVAKKIIIVEDVLPGQKKTPVLVEKVRDHLCATDYYIPMQLFSADQFRSVMKEHGYDCRQVNARYWVGHYKAKSPREIN